MKKLSLKLPIVTLALVMTSSVSANPQSGDIAVSGSFSNIECTIDVPVSIDFGALTSSQYNQMPSSTYVMASEGVQYKISSETVTITITCPSGVNYDFELNGPGESASTDSPGANVALFANNLTSTLDAVTPSETALGANYRLNGVSDGSAVIKTFNVGIYIPDTETPPSNLASQIPYIFTSF